MPADGGQFYILYPVNYYIARVLRKAQNNGATAPLIRRRRIAGGQAKAR